MTRHPDTHKALGQALQDAHARFGQDLPSRDNRFDLISETDDGNEFRTVFFMVVAVIAATSLIIWVFERFLIGGVA
jgi:hypothetical protein